MSMFNDIDWSKRKTMNILVHLLQGISKSMHQNLTMDTGHFWDPEKKASGIKHMQPIMVKSGIFTNGGRFREIRTSRIPGDDSAGRGILKKKNNRDTIHFNGEYCSIDLLKRTVHSANQLCYLRSSHKVLWNKFWRSK